MTYNVFGGTLNTTLLLPNQILSFFEKPNRTETKLLFHTSVIKNVQIKNNAAP